MLRPVNLPFGSIILPFVRLSTTPRCDFSKREPDRPVGIMSGWRPDGYRMVRHHLVAIVSIFADNGEIICSSRRNRIGTFHAGVAPLMSWEILISYATCALLSDTFHCEERGQITVRGLSYPVASYALIAERDAEVEPPTRTEAAPEKFSLCFDPASMSAGEREDDIRRLREALTV